MRGVWIESTVLLCAALAPVAAAASASEAKRPRGVGPEFAKFYPAGETFTCISNPSIQVDFARVNDDYCDCPDGSDEPGTSACAFISPLSPATPPDVASDGFNSTLALPGFYCKNKGHRPSYIPFTHVNDGICDYELCCDGSDEWQAVGGTKCEDRCKEVGKEWRKHDEQRQRALSAASKRRKELLAEASRVRKEVEDRITTLASQIEGQSLKVAGLEKEVSEVERNEKSRVVKATPSGGKIAVLTRLARDRIDEMRNSLANVRAQRDAARERVKTLEDILSAFKEEYNPNFNDEGVKRAVKRWEDYAAQELSSGDESALERDLDEILKSDEENGIDWDEFQQSDLGEVDVLYQFEAYLPAPVREWVDRKLRDLRVLLIENGILAAPDGDIAESKAVTEARSRLSAAQAELKNVENELQKHRDDLSKDYGPEDIFRALKGQCVSKDAGEYTYEFCWMDKTTQKPKKGGASTGMGKFARIETVTVDEDVPANGKGLGAGARLALKFENGQHCWNGPHRSTTVILGCAETDEIWKVVEEEKCVYRMEVGTPAGCAVGEHGNGATTAESTRDEL